MHETFGKIHANVPCGTILCFDYVHNFLYAPSLISPSPSSPPKFYIAPILIVSMGEEGNPDCTSVYKKGG
jgi:hypothetical protein